MKKYIKLFIILSFLFIPYKVFGIDYTYPYEINNYNIDMKVNEDNSFDIKETIEVYFNRERHGIIREIPLTNNVEREDGTSYQNIAKISNIKVNKSFTKTREDDNLKLQIGDSKKEVIGKKKYVISYKYSLPTDNNKNYDELYYNLIGTSWDTEIKHATFKIEMPKDFDKSKIGFTTGTYSSTNTDGITYKVVGNTIEGEYNNTLKAYEGLTVRIELDNNYFKTRVNLVILLIYIIPILSLIISLYLYNKYGGEIKPPEPVEFYPPDNLNSLDIGYIYKGYADNNDVVSLLIYLANKGYIKIIEKKDKSLFKSETFEIEKVKDYDGNNDLERLFLDGLFLKSKNNKVTKNDLEYNFYLTVNQIKVNKNSKENKDKIIDKTCANKKLYIIVFIILTYLTITIIPVYEYLDIYSVFFDSLLPLMLLIYIITNALQKSRVNILVFILIMIFVIMMYIGEVSEYILLNGNYLLGSMIGFTSIIIMIIALYNMDKRTKYGNKMLGRIRGFKNFLQTAEKDKLESLVNEDPEYFYNILPYTYVLGVSDKWIKKFETISMEPPTWYGGYDTFDMIRFNNFMDRTMVSATQAMTSSPGSSYSSGGGFSGGGFSGGGSGGGGGSSW